MAIGKNTRQQVYAKYNGHCAYCGRKLEFEEMQVDHIQAKHVGGKNDLENLNPSCRSCNCLKGKLSLKKFRKQIENQADGVCAAAEGKMSLAYGLIRRIDIPVEFYFEKCNKG